MSGQRIVRRYLGIFIGVITGVGLLSAVNRSCLQSGIQLGEN